VPSQGTHGDVAITTVPFVLVDFMRNNTLQAVYLTVAGASVPAKQGMSSIYTANPRVRVRYLAHMSSRITRGTLHVQRQHSIEA
jgi:hypothetical protein